MLMRMAHAHGEQSQKKISINMRMVKCKHHAHVHGKTPTGPRGYRPKTYTFHTLSIGIYNTFTYR